MQTAMFVTEPRVDNRSSVQSAIYNAYAAMLEEVNKLLQEQHFSAHELYEVLIHRGYLKPAFYRDFLKFLRWAVREGYISKDKIVSRTIKGVRIPNRFTKEQLLTYFHTVDDPRVAVASFIALWSGLRIGDVVKLKVSDFDFEREVVKVVQSKRSKDRIAPFLREGQPVVEKWVNYSGATDYLFPSYESHSMATLHEPHISVKTISEGFSKVLLSSGLQREDERYKLQSGKRKSFTFHTFRHTFCTYHLENEVPAAFVSRAAGHTHMDTTINIYGHMATGNMMQAFRRSYEKGHKTKPEKKVAAPATGFDPMKELAQKFITGEISEDVFKGKKRALEEAGF
jgi:integrase